MEQSSNPFDIIMSELAEIKMQVFTLVKSKTDSQPSIDVGLTKPLNISEAALFIERSDSYVRNLIQNTNIPFRREGKKIWKISPVDLKNWWSKYCKEPDSCSKINSTIDLMLTNRMRYAKK